jgi:hypothetical protein
MRSLLLLPLLLGSLALAGCDSVTIPGIPLPSAGSPPSVSNVQKAVDGLCGVVVTGTTLAKLLSSNATVQSASAWAETICKVVSTAPASDGPTGREKPIVRVNNVRLHGTLPDGRKF